ncbi:fimbrial protein [Variovorax sp. UC122_21]|uniref:fimbrial protein n=1 Tax=Variovorax sp. UC122_21 TaxID=3374554 RepID=UPI003757AD42
MRRPGTTVARRSACSPPLLLAAIFLLMAKDAEAACRRNPDFPINNVYLKVGQTIVMRASDPINKVYVDQTFPMNIPGNIRPFLCQYTALLTGTIDKTGITALGDSWYSTNIPGVAMRLSRQDRDGGGSGNYRDVPYPYSFSGSDPSGTSPIVGFFDPNMTVRVQIKKFQPRTGSGPIAPGLYSRYFGDDQVSLINIYVEANGITVVTPSCTVDAGSQNIPVVFGKVPMSSFSGRGTTAEERKFTIKLDCEAGVSENKMVSLRMDGARDPAGGDGVLKITPGVGVAGGVGIRLKNEQRNELVKFGESMQVGPAVSTIYDVPFSASYIQTADKVTPGQANGMATFTLTYQ